MHRVAPFLKRAVALSVVPLHMMTRMPTFLEGETAPPPTTSPRPSSRVEERLLLRAAAQGLVDTRKSNRSRVPAQNRRDMMVIAGTSCGQLAHLVCEELNKELSSVDITRFSDGEILVKINDSIREKDVFIIQSCAMPVNDNIMELLLMIGAAKRSGASTVTAVIPYFGYKHNKRGLPISTTHSSRFLWNAAGDLAKMLHTSGADKVISFDLQRPGQGQEACFFTSQIPVESISTMETFVDYFQQNVKLQSPVVVVAPNTEYVKKVRKFQRALQVSNPELGPIGYATFLMDNSELLEKNTSVELRGNVQNADVIIMEDIIDSSRNITSLANRLAREGARRIIVVGNHGVIDESTSQMIDLSQIEQVIVSDSMPLPKKCSPKFKQVSVAHLLADIIDSDWKPSEFIEDSDDSENNFELN